MAQKRIMYGTPPFRLVADFLVRDEDFQNDARRILDIDQDDFARLAERLNGAKAFVSRSGVVLIVKDCLGESDNSEDLASTIWRLSDIVHDAEVDTDDAMQLLAKAIETKAEGLEEEEREQLVERLQKLIVDPVGIAMQHKAGKLVGAIGAELDDFRLICDIRPIFDEKHERIDGAFPLSYLRLEYSQPDGEPTVVEVRVSEKQIIELEKKFSDAKRKLTMIKEHLSKQHVTIPQTTSTLSESDS